MTTSAAEARGPAADRVIPEWSLGDRLHRIRKTVKLTQGQMAERLGEKKSTYAAWELDTTSPRNVVAVAKRIEMTTGVPATWVLGVDIQPPGRGPATDVDTRQYSRASTHRPPALALVRDTGESYGDVAAGYGSSATCSQDPYPGSVNSEGTRVPESAAGVNHADAA